MMIGTHIQCAIKMLNELGELPKAPSIAECRGHLLLLENIIKFLRWEQEKALRCIEIEIARKEKEYNRMLNILPPTAGNVRPAYYPQTVEEKHRFLTEAFGIPDETDGKEKR